MKASDRLRKVSLIAVIAALCCGGPHAAAAFAEGATPGMVGKTAPAFSAKTVAGDEISLKSLLAEGDVVVVNFWGIRCAACVQEIAALNDLLPKLDGKKVKVLAFNTDGLSGKDLADAMKENNIISRCTVVADPDFKVMDAYKLQAAPLTYLIGKDGTIVFEHVDYRPGDEKELEKQIEKALAR